MNRIRPIAAIAGLVCLLVGLVLSTVGAAPESIPRVAIVAGLLLLAVWPVSSLSRRPVVSRPGVPMAVGCLLVLALIVLLNALASRHALRWDTTQTGRFTLSSQTRQVLRGLSGPVEAIAFSHSEDREVADLLAEYAAASRGFTYRVIDPDRHPEEAQAYNVRDYGTVVLSLGPRQERLTTPSEQALTSALMRLQDDRQFGIHLLTGHGERSRGDDGKTGMSKFSEVLEGENYHVVDRLLLRDGLPPPGQLVVLAGPTAPLLPAEYDTLNRYLENGGRLLVFLEPEGPGLEEILARRGIAARTDVIVDASGVGSIFGMSEVVPLVAQYASDHPITRGFATATFFPLCRSLAIADSTVESASPVCIAQTSEASWGETGGLAGEKVALDPGETGGPLCVAAASSWGGQVGPDSLVPRSDGRLVVFGDVDFATNAFLDVSGNRDLCMNAVSWLAERGELIAIRPREGAGAYLTLTAEAARNIFILVVVVLPGVVLFAGIGMRLRRR